MGARGLHKLFSNYGVVTDTFIPNKRRKMNRSCFGFLRYNCSVAADMAVQKANGLWCGDCALRVKMAEFGKDGNAKHKMTFAEVVRGRGAELLVNRTIKVYEEGNGWLYESAVLRLKASASVDDFREELVRQGCGDIIVRLGGGRDIVLSFQSAVVMKKQLVLTKEWLYDWYELVIEWRQGLAIEQER
ncbi:hypothetical protein ACSBR2_025357 [Camellia fascicularis]